jgi:glycosyltransferase involved in cell wall biosynthesis
MINGIDHSWIPYFLRKKITQGLSTSSGVYDSSSLQKELEIMVEIIRNSAGLVHFLNGERDIRYSTYFKKLRKWKFVSTFHKPPSVLSKSITDLRYVKKLDGAIAVGVNQLEYLSQIFGIEQVTFIPHGVDTEFFTPDVTKREPRTAIFVGYHLRHFELLNEVILLIANKFPDFKLQVVVDKFTSKLIVESPNVAIYSGVSDIDLLDLYQRSQMLVIPLIDVTACNSILESLACGLPIVTTRLAGHEGYLNNECSRQTEFGNAVDMADAVIELLEDEELNKQMSIASRAHSLNFSWPEIGSRVMQLHERVR